MSKWRVSFFERKRGQSPSTWTKDYDTKEEALAAEAECNSRSTLKTATDYYIQATYKGPVEG